MSSRRKLTSLSIILMLLAAVASWFARTSPTHRGHVSLPPVQQSPVLSAGKARVTKIVDGDTIHALVANENGGEAHEEKVRLYGINAPELHPRPGQSWSDFTVQPYAQEANDFLEKLCPPGSEIKIEEHGRDKYGRLLGVIILPDGRDANKLLVNEGLARAYFLHGSKREGLRLEYEAAQDAAQSARRGIWKN